MTPGRAAFEKYSAFQHEYSKGWDDSAEIVLWDDLLEREKGEWEAVALAAVSEYKRQWVDLAHRVPG
jgi:hypothetical protein